MNAPADVGPVTFESGTERLSTLRAYLSAAGGHARLVVDFDAGARQVELDLDTLGQRPDPTTEIANRPTTVPILQGVSSRSLEWNCS